MKESSVYHRELLTDVIRMDYDYLIKSGRLFLRSGCCVDMTGCIAIFERIDPQVLLIETFAGEQHDTAYAFIRKQWCSRAPNETRFYDPCLRRGEAAKLQQKRTP